MATKEVRVIWCRVGLRPVVETIKSDGRGSFLDEMQRLVGGYVECVGDFVRDGIDLYCNEDGMGLALPLNRVIAAPPRGKPGGIFADAFIIKTSDELCDPDEPGEWRILGDFFLVRCDDEGELASVTDADIAKWSALFDSEDTEAAKRMNEMRVRGAL
jgi:hypothetical protein